MATIIKRNGKWQVKIRRTNFKQLSKTFITKDNAIKWARETESKVEKGLFEDLSQAKLDFFKRNSSGISCPSYHEEERMEN